MHLRLTLTTIVATIYSPSFIFGCMSARAPKFNSSKFVFESVQERVVVATDRRPWTYCKDGATQRVQKGDREAWSFSQVTQNALSLSFSLSVPLSVYLSLSGALQLLSAVLW